MKVPFLDLKRQYITLSEDIEEAVVRVLRSTRYIEGEEVKVLEEKMAKYLDVKNVITCNSGTDAIRIALQSISVGKGDEVITSPFTFYATAEAIAQIGAIPVFADIDKNSFNLDPNKIENKISRKTKAILPVHIFGLPADMYDIIEIAGKYNLSVIEDACQAIGSVYHGQKAGTLGDIGCFSFYPTKNLGGIGDGGMIVTDDDRIAVIAKALKNHGAGQNGALAIEILTGEKTLREMDGNGNSLYDPYKYYNYLIGGNSRLDSIQAAVLAIKLNKLDEYNDRRLKIAKRYKKAFANIPLGVQDINNIDRTTCMHQYAVLVDDKENFIRYMEEKGIGTGEFYPVPLHRQRVFSYLKYKEGDLPIAEDICKKSVCLPVFPELSDEEVDYVAECVISFFESCGTGGCKC